ncbi:hypothetical protein JOF55_002259 [Haloactinomyces albus]|uniref:Uncharacterized protein n=1 Tax=Haloactinomyces albus TaxID=1352928 RepID=A0AAE3ZEA9_9ACTN|nr:hypothetical protein [Haloactinomyces albus]
MTDSGAGFGVDLYRLEKAAKNHLPTVSMVYDKAIGKSCVKVNSPHGPPRPRPS